MKLFILIILSIFLATFVNSQQGVYPDSGVYVSLNSNFLGTFGNQLTQNVQNQINSYAVANVNGNDGKISYSVTNIRQSVQLGDFFYQQTGANTYNIGWNSVTFTISTDYQGCYKIGGIKKLSVCEKGNVNIDSQATLSLSVSMTIDFTQSTPTITCTSTTLNVPANGINYSVHCTSRVCDKTHDITNEIASKFVPSVESGMTTAINNNVGNYLSLFPSLRDLNMEYNGNEFYLESTGSIVESSESSGLTPTMIMALNGGIVVKNSAGQFIYPTQSPSGLPNQQAVENFQTDIAVTLTPYLIESLADAMFESGLPMTITPSEVPLESPVHLNTSDPFFNQTAPGLNAKYPNSDINVEIVAPIQQTSVSINSTGILMNINSIPVNFIVNDETVFQIIFSFSAELTPALSQSGNSISVSGTLDKLVSYVSVGSTIVGDIDVSGFTDLIQLAQGLIKVPTISIQNPLTTYSLSSLSLTNNDQFIQILGNLSPISTTKINLNK
ncbi:hypothetical protein RB653_009819 [Dictyostelium firmibasis]|uniref:Lipid-binding serum glycoprotein C-terminal domain-containing protein n=1 Tax=Dictyostelium firmibasis TaxID=79012 RepID=A0AAN7YP14_9MYCE